MAEPAGTRTYRAGLLCDGPDGSDTGQHDAGVRGRFVDAAGEPDRYEWPGELVCSTCGRTNGFATYIAEELAASRKARGLKPLKPGTLA